MADNPNAVRERKTWQRGQQADFRVTLLNKDLSPIALDTTKYPAFAIYTPSGLLFQQGVMQQFGDPGKYRTLWTIPTNAELSNDTGSWVFQMSAVRSKDLKQFSHTMDFNVIDRRTASTDNRNVVQLGILGSPYRAMWRGEYDPTELDVQIFLSNAPDDPQKAPIYTPLSKASLTQVIEGSTIAYYYDVPASSFLVSGDYTILWNVRETATSPLENEYEQLRMIKKLFVKYIPSIRFAAERLPLDPDAPQKLTDADIVEALYQGTNMLNMYHPVSQYVPENMPQTLLMHWQLLTLRWLLSSQHLVLGAQAFSFSGQTTSLEFDQTGIMDAALGRIDSWVQETITQAKVATKRSLSNNMSVGIRSMRPFGLSNRTFKYETAEGSGNYGQMLGTLSTLGLLP